jgi:AAA15 family ATPase/GTPase
MPISIKKLLVRNFKAFENVEFEFTDSLNIFTGVNNSGKTTALEALALWHECYSKVLYQAGKASKNGFKSGQYVPGYNNNYFPVSDIYSIRLSDYSDLFYNLKSDRSHDILLRATISDGVRDLEISFIMNAANGQNYNIRCENLSRFDYQLLNDRSFIDSPDRALSVVFSTPIYSVFPNEELYIPAKISHSIRSRDSATVLRNRLLQIYNQRPIEFEALARNLDYILNRSSIADKQVEFIYKTDTTKTRPIWLLRTKRNQSFKDISLYGSGTLQIIEILLALYEVRSELTIILLDEPDSHIHRDVQKRILEVLQNRVANIQVFLTTHNESLIRESPASSVFHLEPVSTNQYKPIGSRLLATGGRNIGPIKTSTDSLIRELSGESSLDFVSALESDTIVFVEGTSDAYFVNKLMENASKKYSFWALGSIDEMFSKIGYYHTIFSAIHNAKSIWSKSFFVFDKDSMMPNERETLLKLLIGRFSVPFFCWESYTLESTLLSDDDKLSILLESFLIRNNIINTNRIDILNKIKEAKNQVCASSLVPDIAGIVARHKSRQVKLTERQFLIELRDIFSTTPE